MSKKMQIDIKTTGAGKARGDIKGLDSSIKNTVATMLTATAAIYAMKKALDLSIQFKNVARDAIETKDKFEQVFSSITESAHNTAQQLQDEFKLAAATSQELLGNTGDLLVGFGFAEEQALSLSKRVNTLSLELRSFKNIQMEASEVSSLMISAMSGNMRAIRSLGVVLRLEDESLKALIETYEKKLGYDKKQSVALAVLDEAYNQSYKAIGDFERTQHQLANQERILSETFKELQKELGTKLLPVFENLTTAMNEGVTEAIKNMNAEIDTTQMKDLTEDFKMLGKQIGEMVSILIASINLFNKYKDIFYALNPALGITKKALQGVWEAMKKMNEMYSFNKEPTEEMKRLEEERLEIIKNINKELEAQSTPIDKINRVAQTVLDAAKATIKEIETNSYEIWYGKMFECVKASERLEGWTLKVVAAAKKGDQQAIKIAESLGIELDQIDKLTRGYKLLFEAKGLEDIKQIKPPEEEPTAPFWDLWIETVEDDATVALEGFYLEWAELTERQKAMFSQASQFMGNVLYEAMGGQFDNIEEMFTNMIKRMIAEFAVFLVLTALGVPAAPTGGGGILASIFGMKEGGTVHNKNGKIVKAQSGLNSFMVPTGYPNDSFPIMVQSGERVDVTPAGKVNRMEILLEQLISAIDNKPVANTVMFDRVGMSRYVEGGNLERGVV